jgi:hypothetical protein
MRKTVIEEIEGMVLSGTLIFSKKYGANKISHN